MLPPSQRLLSGRPRNLCPADDPGRPASTAAGDANGGGADVSCGRRRDGASWLAWMSIRSGRYVPSSENPPGQPVALECPERPGRDVGPAAEFVRQFCFRRQPGPRRVFAVPDPPREHGVNVRVGLRVPPRIIQTSHTGSVTAQPRRTPCAPSGTPARGHTSGMVYARVTTSPGRRHDRTFIPRWVLHRPACRTKTSWKARSGVLECNAGARVALFWRSIGSWPPGAGPWAVIPRRGAGAACADCGRCRRAAIRFRTR